MASSHEPMTYDDLSQLYRQEVNSNSLTPVRRDLFKAVATLLTTLRRHYEALLAEDPESIICDGANQNFKNAESHWKRIVNVRAKKICAMAIRTASGGEAPADILSEEEEEYYKIVCEQTKDLFSTVSRMRGKKTRDTNLDQDFTKPPAPVKKEEPVVVKKEEPVVADIPPVVSEFDEEPFDQPIPDPEEYMDTEPVVAEPDPLVQNIDEKEDVPDGMKPVPIRILADLPEFVGPERTYRLKKEDVVTLPFSLAELLTNDGKAVMIKPSS